MAEKLMGSSRVGYYISTTVFPSRHLASGPSIMPISIAQGRSAKAYGILRSGLARSGKSTIDGFALKGTSRFGLKQV